MSFSFHPDAEEELNQAIDYYEDIEPGLGYEFALEVYAAIKRAIDYPNVWSTLEGDIKRSLIRRFPYGVLYAPGANGLLIVAVMNLHREPGYWRHRKTA